MEKIENSIEGKNKQDYFASFALFGLIQFWLVYTTPSGFSCLCFLYFLFLF